MTSSEPPETRYLSFAARHLIAPVCAENIYTGFNSILFYMSGRTESVLHFQVPQMWIWHQCLLELSHNSRWWFEGRLACWLQVPARARLRPFALNSWPAVLSSLEQQESAPSAFSPCHSHLPPVPPPVHFVFSWPYFGGCMKLPKFSQITSAAPSFS